MENILLSKKTISYTILLVFIGFAMASCALGDQGEISLKASNDEVIDTIITFNPETYEEVVQYVVRKKEAVEFDNPVISEASVEGTIDTIITFDPETHKETMQIVKNGKVIKE